MTWSSRSTALLLALFLGTGTPAAAATLAFDGPGGDAWTFRKEVTGHIIVGSCDSVLVAGPAGIVPAARDGARFTAAVPLQEGANELRVLCADADATQGNSPAQRWMERLPDRPKAKTRITVTENGIALDGTSSERAPGRGAPLIRYAWTADDNNPAPFVGAPTTKSLNGAAVEGPRLTISTPSVDGTYAVTLTVLDTYGRTDQSTTTFRVAHGVAHVVDLAHDHPVWLDDAVIYGAIPFFFGPHGLSDITARLDAIAALGVTVLWLSPITDSPDGDFGYAVTDHFHLRASFGSAADLRALVQTAHARKLRVILDVAVNHLSDRHPYFVDAAQRGHASPYYDFFARDAAGKATHYFDWANLENLNYHNAEVRAYVIEAFARWVREFDVDGFRVDASWGIKERAPDFWPQWRAELKRIKPDLLLVAEASARDTYYGRSGFDAAYDWSDQLGQWAWHDAFDASVPTPRLRSALTANRDSSAAVLRFLDNNDTGARFVTRHGPAYTRVAATMLLTLPGLPVIYMGDEVGADFLPYGERRPLDWSDPLGLRAYYARLTALRHAEPGLRSNALTLLDTSPADGVLAYLRPGSSAAQTILVMLNFGGESARVQLPHTEEIAGMLGDDGRLIDLITGEPTVLDRTLPSVSLSPLSARVLRRAAEE